MIILFGDRARPLAHLVLVGLDKTAVAGRLGLQNADALGKDSTAMGNEPAKSRERTTVALLKLLQKLGLKSIATGNFGWFVLLVIAVTLMFRLDSADLKDVLVTALAKLGWLGYPCAGITVWICVRVLRWREQFYQHEMNRLVALRNQLMQDKFQLPLQSSVGEKRESDK